jgi:predicted nucleic acid-binding protein
MMTMNNFDEQIDPRLETLLDELRDVPARDPRRAAQGRAKFLSQAVAIREEAVSPLPIMRLREWFDKIKQPKEIKMTTLMTILTIAGLILGGGAGTVYASQDSLPNDTLYAVKIASENIQLQFANSAEEKFELHAEHAQRRTEEIAALLEEGAVPPEDVALHLQEEIRAMLQLTSEMEGAAQTQAMQRTQTMLQAQLLLIDNLDLPEDALLEAEQIRDRTRLQIRDALLLAEADAEALGLQVQTQTQTQMQMGQQGHAEDALDAAEDAANTALDTAQDAQNTAESMSPTPPNNHGNGQGGNNKGDQGSSVLPSVVPSIMPSVMPSR